MYIYAQWNRTKIVTRRFYRCRVFVKFQLWVLSHHQVLSLYWEVSNLCHRFLLIWVIFLLVDYVLHLHNNNSIVCSLFQQNIITLPAVTAYWNNAVDNICSAGKKCGCFLIYLLNKVKEISYKIINKFYPAKHYMQRWYFLQLLFLWRLYWNVCPKLLELSIYKDILARCFKFH